MNYKILVCSRCAINTISKDGKSFYTSEKPDLGFEYIGLKMDEDSKGIMTKEGPMPMTEELEEKVITFIKEDESTLPSTSYELDYLHSTDWKVMRHIREKALGLPTSMTEEQYIAFEQERENKAKRIK